MFLSLTQHVWFYSAYLLILQIGIICIKITIPYSVIFSKGNGVTLAIQEF